MYNVQNNFDTKKLDSNRQFNDSTLHVRKGYKIYLQVECHFSYYYTHDYIIYCYIHRKYKLHFEGNIMSQPPTPPQQLEKVNSDKYLTRWCCLENYIRFLILDNQFELFKNTTTSKIILYHIKHLDLVVLHVTHNYSSITKICCRHWILKLSSLATFTSKFCNKLSTQFKYLNSKISCITDH